MYSDWSHCLNTNCYVSFIWYRRDKSYNATLFPSKLITFLKNKIYLNAIINVFFILYSFFNAFLTPFFVGSSINLKKNKIFLFLTWNLSNEKDINFLLLGGLVMSSAIELSGLHERIALRALMFFGSNPKWYYWLVFNLDEVAYCHFNSGLFKDSFGIDAYYWFYEFMDHKHSHLFNDVADCNIFTF